jgi:hypothetical protein
LVKLSLAIMVGLTVLIALGLRWREERVAALKPPARPAARGGGLAEGWVAAQKRKLNRWVTAAALAALVTMLMLGGINWLRIWNE